MFEENQGQDAPEINSPETEEAIKELQEQGHEFKGVKSEPKPEPETPKEDTPEEKPEEKVEEPKEEIKEEPKEPKEPVKRESREIPAWKVKMAERRAKQDNKEEVQKEESDKELKQDKSTTIEPEDVDKQIDELTDKLESNEITTKEWAKEFRKLQPRVELPKDISDRLNQLDEITKVTQRQKEDAEFSETFDNEVIKIIKEEHPSASIDDLKAIKAKLKESYFNPRFITLSPSEIYTLQKSELSKEISPSSQQTMEDGKKGVGRQDNVIDYEDITEEDYAKLTPEEQAKVGQYKIDKDNEARGIKTS